MLFRPQALEHDDRRTLGRVLLAQPLSLRIVGVGALVFLAAAALFAWQAEFARRVRVHGTLVPAGGVARASAPAAARVLERPATPGARVEAGTVLFVLALDRESVDGETHARVAARVRERARLLADEQRLTERQYSHQAAGLRRRVEGIAAEQAALEREESLIQTRLRGAEAIAGRFRRLATERFVAETVALQKDDEARDLAARVAALTRTRLALERDAQTARHELAGLPLRASAAMSGLAREIAMVDQEAHEVAARRTLMIRAAGPGIVGVLAAEVGQTVAAGALLATVVAEGDLEAHLWAPARAMGFARAGQAVDLRLAAFPFQKFGVQHGRVREVARSAHASAEIPDPGVRDPVGEPLFRIRVALASQAVTAYGRSEPLVADMRVDADILVDRRRLVEWMVEPLWSLTGRLK